MSRPAAKETQHDDVCRLWAFDDATDARAGRVVLRRRHDLRLVLLETRSRTRERAHVTSWITRCWKCHTLRSFSEFPEPCSKCGCRIIESRAVQARSEA